MLISQEALLVFGEKWRSGFFKEMTIGQAFCHIYDITDIDLQNELNEDKAINKIIDYVDWSYYFGQGETK